MCRIKFIFIILGTPPIENKAEETNPTEKRGPQLGAKNEGY